MLTEQESRDTAEPPFSIILAGHGAAGARTDALGEARADDGPDAQGALSVFARVVHIDPGNPDYHFILGRALIDAGCLAEAVPALRKAVSLHPEEAEYRMSLGHALWRAGRFDEAAAAFTEAAGLQPGEVAAWSGAGAARLAAGDVPQALAALDAALGIDANLADAQGNRGIALWRQGDREAAQTALDSAVRLAPESSLAHRNRGLALLARDRPAQALAAFSAAAQRAPRDADVRADIGEALLCLCRTREAHSALREAMAIRHTCLDDRPRLRQAFVALEASALRDEFTPGRSALARAAALLLGALVDLGAVLRNVVFFRRRVASALLYGVLAVAAYPLWHLTPVYVRHYLFVDDLGAIAATPLNDDGAVHERLLHAARRRGLSNVIDAGSCQVVSSPRWRTITCRYRVRVSLLPAVARTLVFETSVERFYVALEQPPGSL